ncbi:MAG: glycosyltransferase family 39 protein [Noviherbaspirillum sp.]
MQIARNRVYSTERERPALIFIVICASYFLLHLLLRLSLSDTLDLDEAEQAFEAQQLRMGYGTQPPLYNWLQWLVFQVFGFNLFSLSVLKNLLLFATYVGMFRLARPRLGVDGAMAVSASLLLIPQIAWESQRDLTHSVLLTSLACMTLASYFALLRRPTAMRYALFGLLIGLGLQTKYNFIIFAAGLMAANLLTVQHREIFWNRKVWIAASLALLCFLPHGLWILGHVELAVGGTVRKMSEGARPSYLGNVGSGLGSMFLAALAFLTPLWLIYAWVCRRSFAKAAVDWRNPEARFFLCLYGAFFACILILVLSGELSKVKDRWMQPLLFSAPLAFFVILPAFADRLAFNRILRTAAVVALVILAAFPLRVYLAPLTGKSARAHHPYPELSEEIVRRFPRAGTVIASEKLIAGNLHFHQPRLRTLLSDDVLRERMPLSGELVLLERAPADSDWLEQFRLRYPQAVLMQEARIDLPYRYGVKQMMSFQAVHLAMPLAPSP